MGSTYRKKNPIDTMDTNSELGEDHLALRTAQNTEFITISQKN